MLSIVFCCAKRPKLRRKRDFEGEGIDGEKLIFCFFLSGTFGSFGSCHRLQGPRAPQVVDGVSQNKGMKFASRARAWLALHTYSPGQE